MFVPKKNDFIGFNPYHVITKSSSAWKPPAATTQLDLTMPASPSKDSFICQWTKALCTTAFERYQVDEGSKNQRYEYVWSM